MRDITHRWYRKSKSWINRCGRNLSSAWSGTTQSFSHRLKLAYASYQTRIPEADIALFFRHLSTFMQAGIPIIQSLEMLEKNEYQAPLCKLLSVIKQSLFAGHTLSHSLASSSHRFDALTIELIYLGEQTGELSNMLLALSNHLDQKIKFKQQLKQITFYPLTVLSVALIMTMGMFIFIIPRFAALFSQKVLHLPLLTRLLFSLSHLICEYGGALFLLFILSALLFFYHQKKILRKLPFLARAKDSLPFLQAISKKISLTRLTHLLALTTTAGIPLAKALLMVATLPYPSAFKKAVLEVRDHLLNGTALSLAMKRSPLFPDLLIQMVKVGEETGMLPALLNQMSAHYAAEMDRFIHRFSQLLEPLIMLVLGVLIGGLVIGMYLPVFQLGNAL